MILILFVVAMVLTIYTFIQAENPMKMPSEVWDDLEEKINKKRG